MAVLMMDMGGGYMVGIHVGLLLGLAIVGANQGAWQ